MADISFSCASCGESLEAPVEMAGEVVACPSCQHDIRVPSASPASADVAPGAAGRCPDCGADMEADAVLCVKCGFHLGTGKRIETQFSE